MQEGSPPSSVESATELAGDVSHRVARGSAVRGLAEVAGKVATLAWTVAAARLLTSEEFGVVSYALTLMLLISVIPAWGFDAGMVRRGAANPELLNRLHAGVQVWKATLGIPAVAITALVVLPGRSDRETRWTVGLMLASALPELWSQTARSMSSARQRPVAMSTALVAQRMVTGLLIVGVLLAGMGMVAVAAAFLIGGVLGWIAHGIALRRIGAHPDLRKVARADLRIAARGTWLIGLNGLMLMLLGRIDALLLEGIDGLEAVALYAMAYRLLETVLFVTYAVNQAVFPVLSATQDKVLWRRGYERSMSAAAFVYLPFMVVCLLEGRAVASLLYGDRYGHEVGSILLYLAPAPILFAAGFFASLLLMAMHASRPMLAATAIGVALNIGLNLWLIPHWSGVGAAVATAAAYAVQAVGLQVAIRRREIKPSLVRPLLAALVASSALAATLWLLPFPVLLDLLIGAVVYLAVWLLFVTKFDPKQRDILTKLVRRS